MANRPTLRLLEKFQMITRFDELAEYLDAKLEVGWVPDREVLEEEVIALWNSGDAMLIKRISDASEKLDATLPEYLLALRVLFERRDLHWYLMPRTLH